MVTRHLLDQRAAAIVLEYDEIANQVEKALLFEQTLDQYL